MVGVPGLEPGTFTLPACHAYVCALGHYMVGVPGLEPGTFTLSV